jgi:prepilin-type processing-associated H-X9-DG protein
LPRGLLRSQLQYDARRSKRWPRHPRPGIRGTRHDRFHAAARSRHPGGVNAVFADGHVIFTSDTIDLVIWQWLASIDDGYVIPENF